MRTVSVIIPVYCNGASLAELGKRYANVRTRLAAIACVLELVFVDDGSTDDSLVELLKLRESSPATRIVKRTRNFGANEAVRCGMQFAKGDCVVVTSADLQDPPDLIMRMAEKCWPARST